MNNSPRVVIADDEAHLRDYLEQQLAAVWPELRVVGRAANGLEALRLIDDEAPDVVFLDIRMPGLTGLDVAARLIESPAPPQIVFVTAYDQYAVQAFEHSALDYLLKPASLERLSKTVGKLKAALAAPVAAAPPLDALRALLAQLGGPAALSTRAPAAAPLPFQPCYALPPPVIVSTVAVHHDRRFISLRQRKQGAPSAQKTGSNDTIPALKRVNALTRHCDTYTPLHHAR